MKGIKELGIRNYELGILRVRDLGIRNYELGI